MNIVKHLFLHFLATALLLGIARSLSLTHFYAQCLSLFCTEEFTICLLLIVIVVITVVVIVILTSFQHVQSQKGHHCLLITYTRNLSPCLDTSLHVTTTANH